MKQFIPSKKKGVAHLFASTTYSLGVARRLLKEEAAKHELAGFMLVSIGFFLAGVSIQKHIVFFLLFLILIALQALNTAIEEIVDVVSPTYSTAARHAKDLGSLAVFCMIVVNVIYVCHVFIMPWL
ncbi:diacylglycerol kinase [Brucella pseudogrignonensis]|uniref:diacylglycerol kinase n=1 Tax=Brucella pseudogrignonensis TaxID=419475 RepID=UPI0028B9FAD3|nr:diacylglycerol kinase [Brucella pseudogrignonensis]MDT6941139.1 diacylglycerol kinase [Brucella pseudogrignonensis]